MTEKEQLVLSRKEKTQVDSLVGKSAEAMQDDLSNLMKQMFMGIGIKRAETMLENIKQDANRGIDVDKGRIFKIEKLIGSRKKEISGQVSDLFTRIREGKLTVDGARKRAQTLLIKHGKDVEFSVNDQRHKELKSVVDGVFENYEELGGKDKVEEADSLNYLGIRKEISPIIVESREREASVLRGAEALKSKTEQEKVVGDMREALDKSKEQSKEEQKKNTRMSKLNNERFAEGYHDDLRDKFGRMSPRARRISDVEAYALADERARELVAKVTKNRGTLSQEELKELRKYSEVLDKDEKILEEFKYKFQTDGVELKGVLPGSTVIRIEGVDVALTGTRKSRLKEAMKYVVGTEESKANDLNMLKVVLESGAGAMSDAEGTVAAEQILENMKEWEEKYGKFESAFDNLKDSVEVGLANNFVKRGFERQSEVGDRDYKDWEKTWSRTNHDIEGYDENGDPIYDEAGRKKAEFLESIELIFSGEADEYGRKEILANDFMAEFNRKARSGMMTEQMRSARLKAQEVIQKASNLSEEEGREIVQTRVVELIREIMLTEDSSREPANQMRGWELYELIGNEIVDGEFKDLWMARLALYDIGVFMGSAEDYESWAKMASFLPKEFISTLYDSDNVEDMMTIFIDGERKDVGLSFKEVLKNLDLKVNAAEGQRSRRDIWMAEILGSKDLADLTLNKRRFLASMLGEKYGINTRIEGDKFVVTSDNNTVKLSDGTEAHFLHLFGLTEDGKALGGEGGLEHIKRYYRVADDESAKKILGELGKYDMYSEYGWYVNNALNFQHITLRSVAMERGGNNGKWWKYLPNVLRKFHGSSQSDYHHRKGMGMVEARDLIDSSWRSFYGWNLRKRDQFLKEFTDDMKANGITNSEEIEKVYGFIDRVAFDSELWDKWEGVAGELRVNEDVRWFATAEGKRSKNYKEIVEAFDKMDDGLKVRALKVMLMRMGKDEASVNGMNLRGSQGLEELFKNYDMYSLVSMNSLDHGRWKDWIKYTGSSNESWGISVKFGEHFLSNELQAQYARQIESFNGAMGKEVKMSEIHHKAAIYKRTSVSGYETKKYYKKGEDGRYKEEVEGSQNWNITESPNPAAERRKAEAMGYWVDNDGRVYTQENKVVKRPGNVGVLEDFSLLNPPGFGSLGKRRGLPQETWGEQKKALRMALRNRIWSPERYRRENRRFQYRLFTGIDLGDTPRTGADARKMFFNIVSRQPWRLAGLPYTVIRGIFVNLGVDTQFVLDFFAPFGEEMKKVVQS